MTTTRAATGGTHACGVAPPPYDDGDRSRMEEAIAAALRRRAAQGGPARTGNEEVPRAVRSGDTIWAVAHENHDALATIVHANPQVRHPSRIRPGDILFVPTHEPEIVATRRKVADAEAADRSASTVEANLQQPKLPPAVRTALLRDLAEARAAASRQWAGVRTSVEAELIGHGAGTTASQAAMRQLVADIRARAPDSEGFQTAVDDAVTRAPIDGAVRAVVAKAQGESEARAALRALSDGCAASGPAVKDALLRDPGARNIVDAAAAWAAQPLRDPANAGDTPQARAAAAMQRLDQAARGIDRNIAGAMVEHAVSAYEQFRQDNRNRLPGSSPFGAAGVTVLVDLSSRIAGSRSGDDAIARFAAMRGWNADAIRNAIGAGADPAYAIALARELDDQSTVVRAINDGIAMRDGKRIANGANPASAIEVANRMQSAGLDGGGVMKVVTDGMEAFKDKIAGDVARFAKHEAELAWVVQNDGAGMPKSQVDQIVAAYRRGAGAAWQADDTALRRQITVDGSRLLDQMTALNQSPPQLSGAQALVDRTLRTIANDQAAELALSVAISTDPRLADPKQVKDIADIFALSKIGDVGRKYLNELASIKLRNKILAKLRGTDLHDPASVAQAKKWIGSLAESMRRFGVASNDLDKAVKLVGATADRLATATTPGEINTALRELDKKLGSDAALSKTFNKSTRPGQLLRGAAILFAGASLINSWSKFGANSSDPQNDVKLLFDAIGFAQKDAELLVGLGMVDKQSLVGQFGGEWKLAGRAAAGELISVASALLDIVSAARSAYGLGVPQDSGSAKFCAASAFGGSLTVAPAFGASAYLGIVGLGVTLLSLIGKSVYDSDNDAHQYEGVSRDFLQSAGYGEAAAEALSRRAGVGSGAAGAAQMPLLAKYAEFKRMTSDQMRSWVNSLTPDQVAHLSLRLRQAAGDCRGDPRRFTDGPPQTISIRDFEGGLPVEVTLADTVAVFDGYLDGDGVPHP